VFSILVFLSLVSIDDVTTLAVVVVVVVVVVVGGRVVVVVVDVVVDDMISVIDVAVDVRAMSALQGVSLQTLRSRLPPLHAAPPPEAGVSTPRERTCRYISY
jgi:hypothetical protein